MTGAIIIGILIGAALTAALAVICAPPVSESERAYYRGEAE